MDAWDPAARLVAPPLPATTTRLKNTRVVPTGSAPRAPPGCSSYTATEAAFVAQLPVVAREACHEGRHGAKNDRALALNRTFLAFVAQSPPAARLAAGARDYLQYAKEQLPGPAGLEEACEQLLGWPKMRCRTSACGGV